MGKYNELVGFATKIKTFRKNAFQFPNKTFVKTRLDFNFASTSHVMSLVIN